MFRRIFLLQFIAVVLILSSPVQAQQQLNRPQNLSYEDDTLRWDAVENAVGYRVRWLLGTARNFVEDSTSQNSFSMSGLDYGSYLIQVQAVADETGDFSDSVWSFHSTFIRVRPTATATPTRVILLGLRTPQNLRVLQGATVTWDAVIGAVSYRLIVAAAGYVAYADVPAPQTEHSFSGLQAGQSYGVQVLVKGDGLHDAGPANSYTRSADQDPNTAYRD